MITIKEHPEQKIAAMSVAEYITDWNTRMAESVAFAKRLGQTKASGYYYPEEWADPEYWAANPDYWGDCSNALEWLIHIEFWYFVEDYRDRWGRAPQIPEWQMPLTLQAMQTLRLEWLGDGSSSRKTPFKG